MNPAEFFPEIRWRDAWFTLQSTASGTLPPFLGSTLRGALGHLLRSALCESSGCGHECQRPDSCRYFTLFERARTPDGRNAPKPFILLAPPPPGLEDLALGGPINLPYRTAPPRHQEPVPLLRAEAPLPVAEGERVTFGIRLLGVVSVLAPAIIDAIARRGLSLAGIEFRLLAAHANNRQLLYDWRQPALPPQLPPLEQLLPQPEPARRIRIAFLSPTLFKIERGPTFDPADFAARFFEHSLARAVQVHQSFSGSRERLPWIPPPPVQSEVAGHRLFHYELSRHSFRQEKWLEFDGIVGYLDLAGNLGPGLPWARAAQVLNFGQKSAFGLGKIQVFVLE